jgi:hypothetical protein
MCASLALRQMRRLGMTANSSSSICWMQVDQSVNGWCHLRGNPFLQPGEHLWAIRKDGRQLDCELRDHGALGVEVQIYREREFPYGRRWATRALAVGVPRQPARDKPGNTESPLPPDVLMTF